MSLEQEPPAFDDEFVKGAAYTEPSANERASGPEPLDLARARKARKRRRPGKGRASRRTPHPPRGRTRRDPDQTRAVLTVVGGVLVLLAASVALWWLFSGPGAPVLTG